MKRNSIGGFVKQDRRRRWLDEAWAAAWLRERVRFIGRD
jgi:hypothetical protein